MSTKIPTEIMHEAQVAIDPFIGSVGIMPDEEDEMLTVIARALMARDQRAAEIARARSEMCVDKADAWDANAASIQKWKTRAEAVEAERDRLATRVAALEKALDEAEDGFEAIRKTLVKNLDEPERQAFWRSVQCRDSIRTARALSPGAATPAEGRRHE